MPGLVLYFQGEYIWEIMWYTAEIEILLSRSVYKVEKRQSEITAVFWKLKD